MYPVFWCKWATEQTTQSRDKKMPGDLAEEMPEFLTNKVKIRGSGGGDRL